MLITSQLIINNKNMSISNNFVSITDIRQNATSYINDLKKS